MLSVALVTCAAFPLLDDEDRLVIPELEQLGIDATPAVWDDRAVDWASFDAVVIRETWDYPERRTEFVAWLRHASEASVLLNPADVVEWNTDKRYLRDLHAAGVPIVPTVFVEPGDADDGWRPDSGYVDFVVKPAVSAGSRDTARYAVDGSLDEAREHVRRLQAQGRTVMVQPYLDAIDSEGETAMLFLGGQFSHAIRKGPLLVRGVERERVAGLFVQERIESRKPSVAQASVAAQTVGAIPGGSDRVLYARVDLISGPDGSPQLLELELTEPSLFLSHDPQAPERFARAIASRLGSPA
jgi:glutathione synthase/RimK-type ligase-like ATP-grasp enzyme